MIETIRPLRFDGTIGNFGVLIDSTLALQAVVKRSEIYSGPGAIPQDVSLKAARARGMGAWQYLFSLYGRPEQVEANWRVVKDALERSGANLTPDIHDPMEVGELSLSAFSLLNWVGGHGLAWFSPVSPMRGADVARQMAMGRAIMEKHGIDFMTGMTLNGREALNVMPMVFDRSDPAATGRCRACFEDLISSFSAARIWVLPDRHRLHGPGRRRPWPGEPRRQSPHQARPRPQWDHRAGQIGDPPVKRALTVLPLIGALWAGVADEARAQAAGQWRGPEHMWSSACGYCHGAGVAPELRGRGLAPVLIRKIVREGFAGMPPFHPSEFSDADLAALADWIAKSEAPPKPTQPPEPKK